MVRTAWQRKWVLSPSTSLRVGFESHPDGIDIWAVGREEEHPGAAGLDGGLCGKALTAQAGDEGLGAPNDRTARWRAAAGP